VVWNLSLRKRAEKDVVFRRRKSIIRRSQVGLRYASG